MAGWSLLEVEATVADYVSMLITELRHEPLNKTSHRNALSSQLQGRSDTAIERKHQNISAILISLGHPYIAGYKPLGNYQALLAQVVADRVDTDMVLRATVQTSVSAPESVPSIVDILARLDTPPAVDPVTYPAGVRTVPGSARFVHRNYLAMEARNASLGLAGEEFVVNYERARLIHSGKPELAENVYHLAAVEGDGAGFDVRSYETNGTDRLIEVKTTAYGKQTPIYFSSNELAVSQRSQKTYHLYRPFRFRDDPKLFVLRGALDKVTRAEPVQYRGRFA
ncbi:MAG: hypothetical protein JWL60_1217 [Gemmatimonadetes bacterium]|jgi:hypothetical protein|nr:hypothetical protein [Gemmatimonadota bacterium]